MAGTANTMTKILDASDASFVHPTIPAETWEQLFAAAVDVQKNAYAPYSKFQVGAALLTSSGKVTTGCNMENATFGATVCAERHAFGNAIKEGHREFVALCVVTPINPPASPCGICRQIFAEFCTELPVLVTNPKRQYYFTSLDELLPHRFSGDDIELIEVS